MSDFKPDFNPDTIDPEGLEWEPGEIDPVEPKDDPLIWEDFTRSDSDGWGDTQHEWSANEQSDYVFMQRYDDALFDDHSKGHPDRGNEVTGYLSTCHYCAEGWDA